MKKTKQQPAVQVVRERVPWPIWALCILGATICALFGFAIYSGRPVACQTCKHVIIKSAAVSVPLVYNDGESSTPLYFCDLHAPKCDRITSRYSHEANAKALTYVWVCERTNAPFREVNFDGSEKNPHVCPEKIVWKHYGYNSSNSQWVLTNHIVTNITFLIRDK